MGICRIIRFPRRCSSRKVIDVAPRKDTRNRQWDRTPPGRTIGRGFRKGSPRYYRTGRYPTTAVWNPVDLDSDHQGHGGSFRPFSLLEPTRTLPRANGETESMTGEAKGETDCIGHQVANCSHSQANNFIYLFNNRT